MRPNAATIRPILRGFLAMVAALSLFPFIARADDDASSRRDAAKAQYDRAEKARETLESHPEATRTLKDYTALVIEYQRVYLITSHAAEVPASLNEVAELFRTMGDLFDAKFYQRSIDSYQFLLREYPTGKYREDSLLAIAHIQQDDLHDSALAQKTFEQFLAQHPKSPHAAEVRASLDKLNSASASAKPVQPLPASPPPAGNVHPERMAPKNISAEKAPPTTDTKTGSPDDKTGGDNSGPAVSRIRTWNADTYTRIVIDVGAKVNYQAARISGPDRIYFDIEGAKLNPALLRKPIDVDSGFLKTVRVAQNQSGVVRVVLEVNRVTDYSVFLLPDPYRLVVDVYGTSAAAEAAARNTAPAPGPTTADVPAVKPEKNSKDSSTSPKIAANSSPLSIEKHTGKSPFVPPDNAPVLEPNSQSGSVKTANASGSVTDAAQSSQKTSGNSAKNSQKSATASSTKAKTSQHDGDSDESTLSAAASTTTSPVDSTVTTDPPTRQVSTKKSSRSMKSAHDQAEEMGPAPTPELTRDGQRSLTRALGLKIGRIVIDAGHGGHDTGTIGPSGLMEKDLCLDVALRLGKIIQQKLPSAEVVFTRSDDTFIPLERRTEIANEAKADLFISVHANSSQDQKARGIETYYLNFTGSSDAMEVASRENAFSANGVHDLQDIVAKIARNEKIEESRDLATLIQDSLSKRMDNINRGERNRGVRKAPFVVLIGADMPSVLAEISFISNPSDEQWLKKPENRQKVADGLYRGIENYLQSTNSLASNQIHTSAAENIAGK
ncbi:MAG TPA: N-acetylmuramoyl-L-alanine amidase, partial [Candidatus Acidoferrales bacterium]